MLNTQSIPSINNGLNVLFKAFRIYLVLGCIEFAFSLIGLLGSTSGGGGIFGLIILVGIIYALIEVFKGVRILEYSAVSTDMADLCRKVRNNLTNHLIFGIGGGIFFVVLALNNIYDMMYYAIAGVIILVGNLFYALFAIGLLDLKKSLGNAFELPELSDSADKIKTVFFVAIAFFLVDALLSMAPFFGILESLDSSITVAISIFSSAISVYCIYRFTFGYKLMLDLLDNKYKHSNQTEVNPFEEKKENPPTE